MRRQQQRPCDVPFGTDDGETRGRIFTGRNETKRIDVVQRWMRLDDVLNPAERLDPATTASERDDRAATEKTAWGMNLVSKRGRRCQRRWNADE